MQTTLEDFLAIDVRAWDLSHCQFITTWSVDGEEIASMRVETSPNRVVVHGYPISITYTRCYLGGQRPWFQCPNCTTRRAKLFWFQGFYCRTCLGVPYSSTLETDLRRMLRKQDHLEEKLSQKMRQETRERLEREWDYCEAYIVDDFLCAFAGIGIDSHSLI